MSLAMLLVGPVEMPKEAVRHLRIVTNGEEAETNYQPVERLAKVLAAIYVLGNGRLSQPIRDVAKVGISYIPDVLQKLREMGIVVPSPAPHNRTSWGVVDEFMQGMPITEQVRPDVREVLCAARHLVESKQVCRDDTAKCDRKKFSKPKPVDYPGRSVKAVKPKPAKPAKPAKSVVGAPKAQNELLYLQGRVGMLESAIDAFVRQYGRKGEAAALAKMQEVAEAK